MTPKKIALLTDSSADLRWDQARENNIFFVPLRILCEDGEYLDGRHPEQVLFTPNLLEDLKRRDFTINAMAYNEKEGLVDAFVTASCPRPPCPVWRTSARSSGRSLIWDMTA